MIIGGLGSELRASIGDSPGFIKLHWESAVVRFPGTFTKNCFCMGYFSAALKFAVTQKLSSSGSLLEKSWGGSATSFFAGDFISDFLWHFVTHQFIHEIDGL